MLALNTIQFYTELLQIDYLLGIECYYLLGNQ